MELKRPLKVLDPRLIFTDLDGTLIDHYTYSFAPAAKYIEKLQALNVAIIPNTSKTFAEVNKHRKAMLIDGPLIVENGAGVCIPVNWLHQQPANTTLVNGYWVKSFSQARKYWLNVIAGMHPSYTNCFELFSQMTVQRLVEVTGLTSQDAALAMMRQYSEPLLWLSTEKRKLEFIKHARNLGARPLLGGRFLHMCGQSNKGLAMQWLADEIQKQHPNMRFKTIALGDGGNDIDMLEMADIACRIASPVHALPALQRTHQVFDSHANGPHGWVEVLQKIMIN